MDKNLDFKCLDSYSRSLLESLKVYPDTDLKEGLRNVAEIQRLVIDFFKEIKDKQCN